MADRLSGLASPDIAAAALLLAATVAALVWANSPAGDTYASFWHTELAVQMGDRELSLSLVHWVNDGLMALFFFVVGLEVKRELVLGELADRRRAMVPILAAVAGLVVPALVYVAINQGGEVSAWGTVISTDTAFLLGVVALLGRACPPQLRVFLLALAVVDDVGALSVIAVFYTDDLHIGFLLAAAAGVALMFALRWLRVWRGPAYLVLAAVSWVMLYESGVHATLLGVAIALITPAYRPRRHEVAEADRRTRTYLQDPQPAAAHAARLAIERSVPVGERLQRLWRPWTDYVIVPLFALANAGVVLSGQALGDAASSPVTIGVIVGLVVGKPVGILLGSALAVRLRLGELAPGLTKLHLRGGAVLSGIGFTISLLIVELAVPDPVLADEARVGILAASVLAALAGFTVLRLAARRTPESEALPVLLEPPVDAARDHIRGPAQAPLTVVGVRRLRGSLPGLGRGCRSPGTLRRPVALRLPPHTAPRPSVRVPGGRGGRSRGGARPVLGDARPVVPERGSVERPGPRRPRGSAGARRRPLRRRPRIRPVPAARRRRSGIGAGQRRHGFPHVLRQRSPSHRATRRRDAGGRSVGVV